MDDETLYRLLARQLETAPDLSFENAETEEVQKWLAETHALIEAQGDLLDGAAIRSAERHFGTSSLHESSARGVVRVLRRAFARAELKAPAAVRGAFIPVGHDLDAFTAFAMVLVEPKSNVLIVDPYLDRTVVTDLVPLVPDATTIRLLSDEAGVKDSLGAAARRYVSQHGPGRLEVRIVPARTLHDRLIITDSTDVWILTQSVKDFAARSPASVNRADVETASLKVQFYEELWGDSRPLDLSSVE